MSERTQALADAILALTWSELDKLDMPMVEWLRDSGGDLDASDIARYLIAWAGEHRAPTVEVIVEDEQPKGAG